MADPFLGTPLTPAGLDMAALMPPEEPLALGYPERDADYIPAPKFHKTDVQETVSDLKAEHSVRIARTREYSYFLDCSSPGRFADDIEDESIESFPLLGAREDYEFRVGYFAGHDQHPRLLNRDLIDRDEAIIVEDAVTYDFQCEERQYAKQHRSDLKLAKPAHLMRCGMLVGIDVLDPVAPSGIASDLLDPLTIFPVWGGPDGLVECYRVYQDTNESIINTYGGKPGSKEYARLEAKVKDTASKTKRGKRSVMKRGELRTVTEAWSRDELYVILDEEVELLRRSHGYRRVPITIRAGAFDQPVGLSIGTQETLGDPQQLTTTWGEVTVSDASMDLARQLAPFGYRHMQAHRIAEAVAGRELTYFKWAKDPHKILEYDPSTEWKMTEEIDLIPSETTKIPMPNKLNLVNVVADPTILAAVSANLQSNVGGGFLTQMRLGAIPPQTSGSAMGKLQAAGGAGDVTILRTLEGFDRDRAEWRLELRRVHGDSIGSPLGVVRVPARQGYGSPIHDLTPELLERTGTEVDIEYYQFQADVPLMTYVTGLRTPSPTTGKPLIADETAQRLLKFVKDVDREADRIDIEAMNALPSIKQQRDQKRLDTYIKEAMDEGDHDTAAEFMIASGELGYLHDLAVMQGQAAPPGGPGAAPGMGMTANQATPPMAAPPAPAPSMGNTSLPDQGIGVGTEGGRPVGASGPPQPISQPTPVGGRQ
jgi:hypothetical protein